jgi:hypothetical protein
MDRVLPEARTRRRPRPLSLWHPGTGIVVADLGEHPGVFRMSKSDLQVRPVHHRKRDSIEAHLTIVFAALAVSRWIEARTGWSNRKFVKTACRYRTIEIRAGRQTLTAADPLPDECPAETSWSRTVRSVREKNSERPPGLAAARESQPHHQRSSLCVRLVRSAASC